MDVVGEVMWSVGSYLGALGDDPLHPIPPFIDFKISLKTRGSLSFSRNFPFFTISARGPFSGPTDGLGKLGIGALERARFFL